MKTNELIQTQKDLFEKYGVEVSCAYADAAEEPMKADYERRNGVTLVADKGLISDYLMHHEQLLFYLQHPQAICRHDEVVGVLFHRYNMRLGQLLDMATICKEMDLDLRLCAADSIYQPGRAASFTITKNGKRAS